MAANKDLCDVDKRFDFEFDHVELLSQAAVKAQIKVDHATHELSRYEGWVSFTDCHV